MNKKEIFDSLVKNAFDFLEKAIAEFDAAPKYSVIHFCSAVEMLLKARLLQEHWSLIVSKPDQAQIGKFQSGDFISVNLEDCKNRLKAIAGEDIPDEAFRSFRELAKHRNKIIHFFHGGLENDQAEKEKIVSEQCRAWLHLRYLLTRWWLYFSEYDDVLENAENAMKRHRTYLLAKFETLTPQIDQEREAGNEISCCSSCGFESAVHTPKDDSIFEVYCLVCGHCEVEVKLDCPHCHNPITLINEGYGTCEHCHQEIEPQHLVDALLDEDYAHRQIADGDDSWELMNCGFCGGSHTVINLGDCFFCTACFDESEFISRCGWCNEGSTGDLEASHAFGCGACDGRIGHAKDE